MIIQSIRLDRQDRRALRRPVGSFWADNRVYPELCLTASPEWRKSFNPRLGPWINTESIGFRNILGVR